MTASEGLNKAPSMDSWAHVDTVIGAGRGALYCTVAGGGWLGWGLGRANAFNGFTGSAFICFELLLLVGSIYAIREGRQLRKKYPAAPASARTAVGRGFLLVVAGEVVALLLVVLVGAHVHRPDLATTWCAMVIGIHYLPLARIFRAPILVVTAVLMTLWGAVSWVLFRSNALVISAVVGTGTLFWMTSALVLFRARKIAAALEGRL